MPEPPAPVAPPIAPARRLGAFDATMIVMGGIIGAGIFVNPSVVARQVSTPGLVLGAWIAGGLLALIGAFVYAELAARCPRVGGQYAYLRDAYHPMVAFLYGWALLLVVQTGGMAACAITFARYFRELSGLAWPEPAVAVGTLALLTLLNCLGVRSGSNVQSGLMLTKIAALLFLIGAGWLAVAPAAAAPTLPAPAGGNPLGFATALVPVIFAYGGWQTASFVSGEMRDPRRDLPRGLIAGVLGVIALYLAVNLVCLRVLGVGGLAATATPASEVMRHALGERGARLLALGIAVSTVGFLSQSVLTAPRVYYAMARDGVFFKAVGWLHPRTLVPVVAIVLQGAWAAVIALSGKYEQILNYVVALDVIFFGLTGAALFVLRARERAERGAGSERGESAAGGMRVPGHPFTTAAFVLACWAVSAITVVRYPRDSGYGLALLALGAVVYVLWRRPRGERPIPA
jgi:APA family basic amino acid/polyamine antiporter